MNGRIQQLAAKFTTESIDGPYATPYLDKEAFAKAIVEDCIFSVDGINMDPICKQYTEEQKIVLNEAIRIAIRDIRNKFK